MTVVASETFTSTSAPIQYAAVRAFQGGLDIERYLAFWRDVRDDHDAYEDGVREVLIAILCSPNFLYLAEPDEVDKPPS